MKLDQFIAYVTGPSGGLFALGGVVGGIISLRYIAPKVYGPKINSLEGKVKAMEDELSEFRRWRDDLVRERLAAKQQT